MIAASYGGRGPGLVATGLSAALAITYFFIPPYFSFKVGAADLIRLSVCRCNSAHCVRG